MLWGRLWQCITVMYDLNCLLKGMVCWIRADRVYVSTCSPSSSVCFPFCLSASYCRSWGVMRLHQMAEVVNSVLLLCLLAPLMLTEDGWHTVRGSDWRKQVHQQVRLNVCASIVFGTSTAALFFPHHVLFYNPFSTIAFRGMLANSVGH